MYHGWRIYIWLRINDLDEKAQVQGLDRICTGVGDFETPLAFRDLGNLRIAAAVCPYSPKTKRPNWSPNCFTCSGSLAARNRSANWKNSFSFCRRASIPCSMSSSLRRLRRRRLARSEAGNRHRPGSSRRESGKSRPQGIEIRGIPPLRNERAKMGHPAFPNY